jgi:hypothetical protein
MDSQLSGIVTLIRSALKDEVLTLPEDFDWGSAVPLLYEHHLVGIAVRAAARCGIPRFHPAVRQLTALFCKDVATSRLQMQQLDVVYALFQEHGIEYMPVKGAVIKPMYPQSELRAMGDADILIRQEQYPTIQAHLSALGLQEVVESDHEYIWHGGDFKLELHKRLVPSYDKDFYDYYGDGWRLARRDGNSCTYHMGQEDHFIYLLVHFAKHYRDGAISAKTICDFWVYRKACPDMDESYICNELQKLRLLDFYRNILDLLDTWFAGAAPTEAVEILTRTAFQGGIYTLEASRWTVSVIKFTKETSSISGSKYKLLWRKLFPSASALSQRFPFLKKYPVLLPFAWAVRWFDALFLRRSQLKRGLSESQELMNIDIGRVSEYENQLRAVGLGFNFPE